MLGIAWIVLGCFWRVQFIRHRGPKVDEVRIGSGKVAITADDRAAAIRDCAFVYPPDGIHVRRLSAEWPGLSLDPGSGWFESRDAFYVQINVRPFLLITALPTILLWLRAISGRDGECEACRYDLTRNTSGVCPECGLPVSPLGVRKRTGV